MEEAFDFMAASPPPFHELFAKEGNGSYYSNGSNGDFCSDAYVSYALDGMLVASEGEGFHAEKSEDFMGDDMDFVCKKGMDLREMISSY